MVENRIDKVSPLSDLPWSLPKTYFNLVTHPIDLSDRDAAIQQVIQQLQTGLPVQLWGWDSL
jgi:hypothetical protein